MQENTQETARLPVCPFISDAITFCKMKRDFSSFMGGSLITPAPVFLLLPLLLGLSFFGWGIGEESNHVVHRTKTKLVFRVDPVQRHQAHVRWKCTIRKRMCTSNRRVTECYTQGWLTMPCEGDTSVITGTESVSRVEIRSAQEVGEDWT